MRPKRFSLNYYQTCFGANFYGLCAIENVVACGRYINFVALCTLLLSYHRRRRRIWENLKNINQKTLTLTSCVRTLLLMNQETENVFSLFNIMRFFHGSDDHCCFIINIRFRYISERYKIDISKRNFAGVYFFHRSCDWKDFLYICVVILPRIDVILYTDRSSKNLG